MAAMSRRGVVRLLGALALATALSSSGAAAADPQASSAEAAIVLSRELTGALAPNPGGSYAFYKFWYEGDGSVATVNLQVTPDDPTVLQNVGIVIFDPFGAKLVDGGRQPGLQPNVSGNVIVDDGNRRGFYTVQVYSYDRNAPISFRIWGTGLPPQPGAEPAPAAAPPAAAPSAAAAPPPAAEATPAPEPPAEQQSGDGIYRGSLKPGETGLFEFTYPGDRSVYTMNVHVTPENAHTLRSAGFRIFGPRGNLVVQGGAQAGLRPNVSANVIGSDAGTHVVQVFNDSQVPIDYEIWLAIDS